jgi:hypothetical protein
MICFEIWVNNQKVCVAGIGDSGVLAAHVTWSQRRPEESSTPKSEWKPSKPNLHVGGLVNQEHVRWTEQSHYLEAGDEVTFKIIEADTADEPIRKEPEANPEKRRKKRYEQYKLLKREFEGDESIAALEMGDTEEAIHFKARLMLEYKEEFEAWKSQKKQERG